MSAEPPGLIAPDAGVGPHAAAAGRSPAPATAGRARGRPDLDRGSAGEERPPGPKHLTRGERRRLRRLRARPARRTVRHVDPWSVLLVSLGFYLCVFAVLMSAGMLLWVIGSRTGTIGQIEGVIKESFAEKSFSFDGPKIFRVSVLGGLVVVIVGTAFNVFLCALFNLISRITGGIRVTVIEEEPAKPVG